ncbi:MAG: DUF2971 domain-containing protein [Nitrosomonadaceae bacterium]
MRVYYMTTANWAETILQERRLKQSRFFESNDPFELMLIDSRNQYVRKISKMIATHHNKTIGMLCFGKTWSSPVMWAHYAEKHTGVCLGFEVEDKQLTEVAYTDDKIKVEFGEHLPRHGLSAELLNRVLTTKATDWRYEQEVRALAELKTPDPSNGLYYTDFGEQIQLREIIIGHRCEWTIAHVIAMLGDVVTPVRICKARPAFGSFQMIEQQRPRSVTVKPPLLSAQGQ